MLALYRCGRQAEALEAFTAYPHLLEDELGLEPSERLRAQQAAILRQAAELDGPHVTSEELVGGSSDLLIQARDAPAEETSFVGRVEDIAEAVAQDRRGAAGHAHRDRRCGQDPPGRCEPPWLCPTRSPMASRGASWPRSPTLRQSSRHWPPRSASAVNPRLASSTRWPTSSAPKRLLLVLDNCEHVLDGVRRSSRPSCAVAHELVVLATSREQAGDQTVSGSSPCPATASRLRTSARRQRAGGRLVRRPGPRRTT